MKPNGTYYTFQKVFRKRISNSHDVQIMEKLTLKITLCWKRHLGKFSVNKLSKFKLSTLAWPDHLLRFPL